VDKKYPRLKEKMESFFRYSAPAEHIDTFTKEYEKGIINQKVYTAFMMVMKQSYLPTIKHKLGSESSLRDKLYELTTLGLIEKKQDKKGYPYYVLTDLGKKMYLRWSTHNMINININDDEIEKFHSELMAYIFKKMKVSFR
jgi:predicted transcriptional regulator with HTH domain